MNQLLKSPLMPEILVFFLAALCVAGYTAAIKPLLIDKDKDGTSD